MNHEYRLVKVTWQDSRLPDDGWQRVDDIGEVKPTICETVGWLIRDENGLLILASSITHDEDGVAIVLGVHDIPSRVVDEIVDLK